MSNVAALCHSCANEVTGQQISCRGYCSAIFHLKCSGVADNQLVALAENKQIFWMCRSCTNLLSDVRHRKSVQSAFESGQESFLNAHNLAVSELKSEILNELRTEIRTNFATLINSNSLTPKSANRRQGSKNEQLSKRLFGLKTVPEKQQQPGLLGTGKPVSATLSSMFVANPTPKFWLYITKISRRVTEEQVSKLATERLGTEDVEVTRLVAKGKDVSTMSFISFKIGMDPALKEKALNSSTWPQGLVFREFDLDNNHSSRSRKNAIESIHYRTGRTAEFISYDTADGSPGAHGRISSSTLSPGRTVKSPLGAPYPPDPTSFSSNYLFSNSSSCRHHQSRPGHGVGVGEGSPKRCPSASIRFV